MKPDIPPIAVCRSAGYGVNAQKEYIIDRVMTKLTVEPPYHFGWKVKDERDGIIIVPDGTHQEIDLDNHTTDIMLYKGEKAYGWWKILKEKL